MNIYYIGWVQSDYFGLGAVVVANTESEALGELNLDPSYNDDVRVTLMGICTDGSTVVHTVCRESL